MKRVEKVQLHEKVFGYGFSATVLRTKAKRPRRLSLLWIDGKVARWRLFLRHGHRRRFYQCYSFLTLLLHCAIHLCPCPRSRRKPPGWKSWTFTFNKKIEISALNKALHHRPWGDFEFRISAYLSKFNSSATGAILWWRSWTIRCPLGITNPRLPRPTGTLCWTGKMESGVHRLKQKSVPFVVVSFTLRKCSNLNH